MSVVVILPDGETVQIDARDSSVIVMDWDTEALPSSVTIASSSWRIQATRPEGISVSSITRSSTTATVTTTDAHGYSTNDWIAIDGAAQDDYNITAQITVISTTAFTYTVANSPTTPATGTITAASGLGKDNASIGSADKLLDDGTTLLANRFTTVRLIGGGSTAYGKEFEVSNTIVTNEVPTQTKDRSFFVVIADL